MLDQLGGRGMAAPRCLAPAISSFDLPKRVLTGTQVLCSGAKLVPLYFYFLLVVR
jgi:hypothetical protein